MSEASADRELVLDGIHHISAVTADARANLAFYADVLGLRFVKRSINQDEPSMYHLYYGDETGSPGTIMTFFEIPGAGRGTAGAGMVHRIVWRVPSTDSLDFWVDRLAAQGLDVSRDGASVLFSDPEGLGHELVAYEGPEALLRADHPDVPAAHAISGFHAARSYVRDRRRSASLLRGLGFASTDDGAEAWQVGTAERSALWFLDEAPEGRAIPGAGTVHHIAWGSPDDQLEPWRTRVARLGQQPTPLIDRFWFHSVYFREPSGVLFEFATPSPGFAVDEPVESLGSRLVLPPRFEPMRSRIEERLTPLVNPRDRIAS
jgi:glyoxalase family protein